MKAKFAAWNSTWPRVKLYDGDHLRRIALPLGGIGTGTVSLGGNGNLRNWEIMNRPAKGFNPHSFFALYTKSAQGHAVTRLVEGPLDKENYEGAFGSTAPTHGMPRFRQCSFAAAYPFGQVRLSDPDVPVAVRLEGFNPLIPPDAEKSGIPLAVLRFVLTNRTNGVVRTSLCGVLRNFIGQDGSPNAPGPKDNFNQFRASAGLAGIFMASRGVAKQAEQYGSLALATLATRSITYRTNWMAPWNVPWTDGDALLDFWDDLNHDGRLSERTGKPVADPMASLAVASNLPAHSERTVTFLVAWHFPNRQSWTPLVAPRDGTSASVARANLIGNYYTTRYRDAWDVVKKTAPQLAALEHGTLRFVQAFCGSDLPVEVKEAALFNLSTLRTQTCFRTPDGKFFGWEGCMDHAGICQGNCTHVWNYEQATPFLFGKLARDMRATEFDCATDDTGLMSFRVYLPLSQARKYGRAAADGQMGCILKIYREWQLSGDNAWLARLWPKVKAALAFCWIAGGWDADRDGVMEGCQHNTMDVEYFGPNPQMEGWYLGALRAGEEMARQVGEADFAAQCRTLFERGSKWTDRHLFNGEYFEHQVRVPADPAAIAKGLNFTGALKPGQALNHQLEHGCLVDQLVGQYMAHLCGLGYLLAPAHVRRTLQSILAYNRRKKIGRCFNSLRGYALGDESGLVMAHYPKCRPQFPFIYFTEVMTGFEYVVAVQLIQEGRIAQGLECIRDIRHRFDGRKRSPFDEAECGHHYARAMAAWAAVPALTGFHYSGVTGTMTFAARRGCHFWSNGSAWGQCRIILKRGAARVGLSVLKGRLTLKRLELTGLGATVFRRDCLIREGQTRRLEISFV
ncbi:MAG: GH116 family glycosyl-hydrolase [Kiritimatiellae bacterium]|nr:GH116 family glycosyl-hydrolase [Kiritimatiellia bacterium]